MPNVENSSEPTRVNSKWSGIGLLKSFWLYQSGDRNVKFLSYCHLKMKKWKGWEWDSESIKSMFGIILPISVSSLLWFSESCIFWDISESYTFLAGTVLIKVTTTLLLKYCWLWYEAGTSLKLALPMH